MNVYIDPNWLWWVLVIAPVITFFVCAKVFEARGSYDFTPLIGLGISGMVAAGCWSFALAWWWFR